MAILVTTIQVEREKAIYQYGQAFERGDLETLAEIRRQAETDPALERALDDLDNE